MKHTIESSAKIFGVILVRLFMGDFEQKKKIPQLAGSVFEVIEVVEVY